MDLCTIRDHIVDLRLCGEGFGYLGNQVRLLHELCASIGLTTGFDRRPLILLSSRTDGHSYSMNLTSAQFLSPSIMPIIQDDRGSREPCNNKTVVLLCYLKVSVQETHHPTLIQVQSSLGDRQRCPPSLRKCQYLCCALHITFLLSFTALLLVTIITLLARCPLFLSRFLVPRLLFRLVL